MILAKSADANESLLSYEEAEEAKTERERETEGKSDKSAVNIR